MTDKYQRIRAALAMGPTPGPRRVIDGNSYPYVAATLPENEGRRWDDPIICALYENVTPDSVTFGLWLEALPNAQANAAFIAACDPDTIQSLLEELDALKAENERLAEQAVTDEMIEALQRIRETAMRQTVIARIPECGEFSGIAQDADWLLYALKAAKEKPE